MSLRLDAALSGDLKGFMAAQRKAAGQAVVAGVRQATFGLRNELRRQVKALGFRHRGQGVPLHMLIVAKVHNAPPGGDAVSDVWGEVYDHAIYRKNRPGGAVDIITVLDEGAYIQPNLGGGSRGAYLAIATENAPMAANGRRRAYAREAYDSGWRFRFQSIGDGHAALIAVEFGGAKTAQTLMYVLVPSVSLPKRISIDAAKAKWLTGGADRIATQWDRLAVRAGVQ